MLSTSLRRLIFWLAGQAVSWGCMQCVHTGVVRDAFGKKTLDKKGRRVGILKTENVAKFIILFIFWFSRKIGVRKYGNFPVLTEVFFLKASLSLFSSYNCTTNIYSTTRNYLQKNKVD